MLPGTESHKLTFTRVFLAFLAAFLSDTKVNVSVSRLSSSTPFRARCRSLWTTCSRPSWAPVGPSRWRWSTSLTCWTSRRRCTTSPTRRPSTSGRPTGDRRVVPTAGSHRAPPDGGAVGVRRPVYCKAEKTLPLKVCEHYGNRRVSKRGFWQGSGEAKPWDTMLSPPYTPGQREWEEFHENCTIGAG